MPTGTLSPVGPGFGNGTLPGVRFGRVIKGKRWKRHGNEVRIAWAGVPEVW